MGAAPRLRSEKLYPYDSRSIVVAGRPPRLATPPRTPKPAKPEGGCQIGELFRVLGKAHMLDLLYVFIEEGRGPRRFVEVQDLLGLSPNTLSDRLRELVDAGLLTRTAYNEIPPRVDYQATAKALDLRPVFESLGAWAKRNTLEADEASVRVKA